LLRIHTGNEWITNCLDHAVTKTHENCRKEQRCQIGRDQGTNDPCCVKNKGNPHAFSHSKEIDDRAADNHRECETPECRHERIANLFERQANAGRAKYGL